MKRLLLVLLVVGALSSLVLLCVGCGSKAGEAGAIGATGVQGVQGEQGDTGATGAKGDAGATGATGATGAMGAKGEKGDRGASGSAGAPGATGATGVKGDKGDSGISGAYVILIAKDTTWQPIPNGAAGYLFYEPVATTFNYNFKAYKLEPNTNYSLIYYADFVDRYNQWGGNNPGALIAVGQSNSVGTLILTGSTELSMCLPCQPDANIAIHNYSGAPDYYAHAFGAKIWLVPSDCYDAMASQVITWSPTRFLFETDLIAYIDIDS